MTCFKDSGLQLERTKLSWGRTALVMLIIATVLLKLAIFNQARILLVSSLSIYASAYCCFILSRINQHLIYDLKSKTKKLKQVSIFIATAALFFILHLYLIH
ncbi:DUF202 domain-containing protein [Vibrio sp. SS-MA-C1-2]|uniref:DUF202 domain-containing protein n=1 Tax=Vibrio sp. SS-MA-C1-2 TaxID=2908646 RepID=UPI001F351710|nr:DUF202 domain-containing protein [Vibrio sp. SS-MA-C1-2]UJF17715.1 DUF202 domain-containing protein [Vibrio sp. SS-MA-C1-2]